MNEKNYNRLNITSQELFDLANQVSNKLPETAKRLREFANPKTTKKKNYFVDKKYLKANLQEQILQIGFRIKTAKYKNSLITIENKIGKEQMTSATKSVLNFLIRSAWKNGYCWPRQKTIALKLGITKRTVIRATNFLREKNYVFAFKKWKLLYYYPFILISRIFKPRLEDLSSDN